MSIKPKSIIIVELKQAYQIAKKELDEIYSLDNSDFRLEQAEFNKKKNQWEIVVSFLVEAVPMGQMPILIPKYDRIYKTFKIKDSGEVAGFYIFNDR